MKAPCSLPPVSDEQRRTAFELMRWRGWSFTGAMQDSLRRQIIEARASQIRTTEWKATQQRSVVPVKRAVLGSDGHPLRWITQMAPGELVERSDLFGSVST